MKTGNAYIDGQILMQADLTKVRARAIKDAAKFKRSDIVAHYQAQIDAIDVYEASL